MRAETGFTARLLVALTAAALVATSAYATIITVDMSGTGDYSAISPALDSSSEGDTVLVYPGEYTGAGNREIAMPVWSVTLVSRDGPEMTTLNLESYAGILVDQSQTTETIIAGFTIAGGGIPVSPYSIRVENGASCTVRNCRIPDRTTFVIEGAGDVAIEDCEFNNNNDALRIDDPLQLTLRGCTFLDNHTGVNLWGLSEGGEVSLTKCEFDGNGRALLLHTQGTVLVDSCSFVNGVSSGTLMGGAGIELYCHHPGNVLIRECAFNNNSSTRSAGAIRANAYDDDCLEITYCIFADNTAAELGGAIQSRQNRISITGCTFLRNTARLGGAVVSGIEGGPGVASIADCVFEDNEAQQGGAIAATNEYTLITGCEFHGNRADMGAAIFGNVSYTYTRVSDCLFSENEGYIWGGGLCFMDVFGLNAVDLENSAFVGNTAHRGAAVLLDHSRASIEACTMSGNASDDASIVAVRSSQASIERCIMSFASAGVPVSVQLSSETHMTNCLSFGNAGGDSLAGYSMYPSDCLYTDPLFCDASSDDYTLCANSPGLPDNNPWSVQIGAYDQGCDECDSRPVRAASWGVIKAMYR
jgi:predicted outer membrane repeat protein